MKTKENALSGVIAFGLILVALALYFTNIVYLFQPALFAAAAIENLGLVFYSLATAGAAFAAWGYMLKQTGLNGINKQQVMRATAIGFLMLGLMRVVTAILPPSPFENLMPLLLGEFVLFTGIAIVLFRVSLTKN